MANSKIPSVQITDTFNTQRGRFNQLVDSVGDVSTLTTTATDITNAIKEHDAELGTITSGAMGTTASTVSTAIAELDGRLDSINTVELLSPRMSLSDGTAVNTIAGKLEVSDSADFADNLSVQGNLAVGGNTTMSGTLTVDGEVTFKAGTNSNINLGDANTDNVVFNADVNSNIIPNTDDTYDLGSSTQEWRHVYVDGTVNTDNLLADSATVTNNMSVGGTLDVTGDTTLSNTITVQDSAYITGNLDLGSNLDVAGNVNVTGTVVSEGALTVEDSAYITSNLDVGGNVTVAGDTTFTNTITVQDSAYITGNLDLGSELTVAGDATFANTITVQDSAYITGNLDIGGDVISTGTAFTISAETGTNDNVSLGDTITFEAGEGINTTVSNNNIKIDGELATSSNKGVASFSTDNFLVTSGVVTIKDNGVALGTETTGNYMSGITGTTDEITVTHTPGEGSSATISLPDDVTIGQDLDVTRNLTVTGTFTVGGQTTFSGGTRYAASFNIMNDQVNVNDNNRAGIAIDRPSTDSAVLQWNELGDYWEAGLTTSVNRLALQNDSATFTNIYQTGSGATRLPAGTTAQRPTAKQGQVRYNTSLSAFEGYSGSNWGSLGGLIDVDQDTYIVAERVASSDSDTLQFYAAGTKVATLNTSSFDIEEPININDTTQASNTTSGALIVDGGAGIAKNAHVGGTLDVTGIARLNNTTDATSSTSGGSLTVDGGAAIAKKLYVGGNTTFNNDVFFDGATSGYDIEWDKSDHSLTFLTGTSLKMGNGDDMSLLVNGDADTVLGTGNNTFYLRSADMRLQSNSSEDYVRGQANGAVTLYHNASNKLATTVYGVDVVGLMEADSAVISGDISIGGNLTVSGTTTTINTETLSLQDNKILLNSNSAATPTEDAGLEVERGNSNNVFLQWDEGTDRWRFTNDGSTYYSIPISTEYNNYSLPAATSTVRGGIELFSNTTQSTGAESVTSTADRTYGIQVNSSGQAVVNVPWTDNDTVYSLPEATSTVRGGIELFSDTDQTVAANTVTATASRTYGIQLNSAGQAVVNVPWVDTDTDTNTTYSAGTDLDLSGTTFNIESELNGVNSIKAPTNDSLTIASHAFLKLYSGHSGGTPTGGNTMQLYAGNYQFSFGTDATNQFGIYEDTSLGGPKLTTTQFEDNLAIDAGGDVYLRPTGDNVFMQGITSGEQLNFTLSSSQQAITASDELVVGTTAGDLILEPETRKTIITGDASNANVAEITIDPAFNTSALGGATVVGSHGIFLGADSGNVGLYGASSHGYGEIELNPKNGRITMFNGGVRGAQMDLSTQGDLKIYTDLQNSFGGSRTLNSTFTSNELRVQGDVTAFYSSDRTLKENIVEIDNALDKILAIRGVYFDWTDEHIESRGGEDDYFVQKHDVGVIAQEVEEVLPEVVKDREDGTKAVDYHKIIALLIEGVKEQQVQIDDLKEEIRLMKE